MIICFYRSISIFSWKSKSFCSFTLRSCSAFLDVSYIFLWDLIVSVWRRRTLLRRREQSRLIWPRTDFTWPNVRPFWFTCMMLLESADRRFSLLTSGSWKLCDTECLLFIPRLFYWLPLPPPISWAYGNILLLELARGLVSGMARELSRASSFVEHLSISNLLDLKRSFPPSFCILIFGDPRFPG